MTEEVKQESLVNLVFATSDRIKNGRGIQHVLHAVVSELGELNDEVAIECGMSYKTPSVDGVIGEAIDLIVSAIDLIRVHSPLLTEQELCKIAELKLQKWERKVSDQS